MKQFSNSWKLVKQSYAVLKQDKELMLFPILSVVLTIIAFISLFIPFSVLIFTTGLNDTTIYLLLFVYYVITSFIVIFFNTGLIACAHIRLNGKDPTFKDGLKVAWNHLGSIFIWSLISATVGIILRIIVDKIEESEKLGPIGKIVGLIFVSLLGMTWSLLTFFVIPVIVFENKSVFASIKESGGLFKKTWGENVIGQFSVGLIFGLLSLIGIGAIILAALSGSFIVFLIVAAITIIYWTMLGIISASLNGIFVAALYKFATTGAIPHAYSPDLVKNAFVAHKKRF